MSSSDPPAPLKFDDFAPQIIWLAIVFAFLYVVLKRVALPRVGEVIEERQELDRRRLLELAAIAVGLAVFA